ncbi:hypothetical protein [Achromobacter aloeverae]|uniref:Uncharacterized protein n=1 Tax=Achromobacter aloeverae TaxID=1750518 RepID=A0A4Q1HD60_9BURK|nr:hypothetical protein [Achromobacter aloeverae]RXN83831.1 hypothetical protein C7R54_26570 [Achromobacter aloeverae]
MGNQAVHLDCDDAQGKGKSGKPTHDTETSADYAEAGLVDPHGWNRPLNMPFDIHLYDIYK